MENREQMRKTEHSRPCVKVSGRGGFMRQQAILRFDRDSLEKGSDLQELPTELIPAAASGEPMSAKSVGKQPMRYNQNAKKAVSHF